jgi:outer membrane protein OmpA-like peptidoglycan-associated protein
LEIVFKTVSTILSVSPIAEVKRMYARVSKSVSRVLALAFVALMPVAMAAQDSVKPVVKADAGDSASKWDIFLGYSYLAPKATVDGVSFNAVNYGTIASVSGYFNKNVGITAEGDAHILLPENGVDTSSQPNNNFSGGSVGMIFRYPTSGATPFFHALVGAEQVGSYALPDTWGVVLTVGGGVDYNTPLFDHHLAIRVFQADYQYTHENFGMDRSTGINMARVSAGVVFHIGSFAPPTPVTLACSANPTSIFPGEPVTVTATAGNLDPKLNAIYSWSGSGVTGSGATASVATAALTAGSYTVNCGVKEGRPGKEGLKPWESANASASFTVKAYEPPTISCSANPSTIKPGETSTVTAMGMSPQNRPLTYSYSTSAGTISGSGTTAAYSSEGAPTGTTEVACNVSDDKGQTATANTSVTIAAPYVPPIPHTQALCSITFSNDAKRPWRVDNEAKACLDEVALDLQKQSDAKAVVVGDSTAAEKAPKKGTKHAKVEDLAAERAVNTKDYLVVEKGIDASRISVATGATDEQKAENYLVPSGATFSADVTGTTPVDETVVKPQARKPLPVKAAPRKTVE